MRFGADSQRARPAGFKVTNCEHEIRWKMIAISLNGLVENFSVYAVEFKLQM